MGAQWRCVSGVGQGKLALGLEPTQHIPYVVPFALEAPTVDLLALPQKSEGVRKLNLTVQSRGGVFDAIEYGGVRT
jgi:hypothetical protein